MLSTIAIIPSAPVLVPELAGAAAGELTALRDAVCTAGAALPAQWLAVGAGPADGVFGPDAAGTFAGFGAEVAVRLSPQAGRPTDLPLCALIAAWVRARVCPDAAITAQVCADPATAAVRGRRLRAEIDRAPEPTGVLLIADGANTLTAAAPGGHQPGDVEVQRSLDDALARGETAGLTGLPAQIVGRAGWAALAGLAGPAPWAARELYRGAPYGVGYFVGVWQRCAP